MYKLSVAVLLACSVFLISCTSEDQIRGSFDGNKDSQGGPSGTPSRDDYAFNLASEWTWGLNGAGRAPIEIKGSAADERNWLPAGYEATPASNGRFLMGTSLEFVQKAAKWGDAAQHLNYLVAIQDIQYHYQLKDAGTLIGGLGPYIGYGLGGSAGSGTAKVAAFSDDGYKRFDAGLHLMAGYKLPSTFQFGLAYELGLYDKSTNPSDWTSYNRTWSIWVGYSLTKIIHGSKK